MRELVFHLSFTFQSFATSTLKLNAVLSELVEYRSTSAAERDDNDPVAATLTPSRVRKLIVVLPTVVN